VAAVTHGQASVIIGLLIFIAAMSVMSALVLAVITDMIKARWPR
jgi:hypothetical protein